jgi:hypothetical protein
MIRMPNKTILVKLRSAAIQHVRAARVEIHGGQLAFVTSGGKLSALFLLEHVESWNEIGGT